MLLCTKQDIPAQSRSLGFKSPADHRDPEEHGLPFVNGAIWIMSHSAHKSFQDTGVSKSSDESLDSVDCSKPLFINDKAWLRNCCRL